MGSRTHYSKSLTSLLRQFLPGLSLVVALAQISCARPVVPQYHESVLTIKKSIELNYLLYVPPDYDPRSNWPLVLYLTGSEVGRDIDNIQLQGPPRELHAGLEPSFFLLAPQLPQGGLWDAEALMALLSQVQQKYMIDAARLFITGAGDQAGWAVWDLATSYPGTFARIAPLSAPACTEICRVGSASIRIFHGALDPLVPLADAENMRFELDHYCQSDVVLTVFDSLGHDIQDKVYGDSAFWEWFTGSGYTGQSHNLKPLLGHLSRDLIRKVEDHYLLYLPRNYRTHQGGWPLVVYLHGSGSAIQDIEKIREGGPPKLFEAGKDGDFVLLAPQLHDNVPWDVERIQPLILEIVKEYQIDSSRIYLTGLSRGGFGAWELAVSFPELFAAVAPISARDVPAVERLAQSNIWIFHGAADDGVPWQGSQVMYERLRSAGANVRFSLFEGVGHNAWDRAYGDPEFWTWLLSQKNTSGKTIRG